MIKNKTNAKNPYNSPGQQAVLADCGGIFHRKFLPLIIAWFSRNDPHACLSADRDSRSVGATTKP